MPLPIITKSDIYASFKKAEIEPGEILYVASFLAILGNRPHLAEDVITALLEVVGDNGTIIMPTFNFGFCHGEPFDKNATVSKTGVLSEVFRRRPEARRMIHPPYHSVAAVGKYAAEIDSIRSTSSFGRNSVFQWMFDKNARTIFLGCDYEQGLTQLHWLEEILQVPYRFWKKMKGEVKENGQWQQRSYHMYARRLDLNANWGDINALAKKFEQTGAVTIVPIGFGKIKSFLIQDLYNYFAPRMQNDPLFLLADSARPSFQEMTVKQVKQSAKPNGEKFKKTYSEKQNA